MIALPKTREWILEWGALLPLILVLSLASLLFGGAVWWFRPIAVVGLAVASMGLLIRTGIHRSHLFLKSPVLLLLIAFFLWSAMQLIPLPRSVVSRVSPMADRVHSQGMSPDVSLASELVTNDLQQVNSRIPISLNRSVGFRNLIMISLGLVTCWFIGLWTDRQSKLIVILGLFVATGMLHSAILGLQILDGSTGLIGYFKTDHRLVIGPGWLDASMAPHWTSMEMLSLPNTGSTWPVSRIEAIGMVGLMPGGFSSFAALQSIALPTTLGCLFFLAQRRGSRFELIERLKDRGFSALAAVLLLSLFISGLILGSMGSALAAFPAMAGSLIVCLLSLRSDLEKRFVLLCLTVLLISYGLGASLGSPWIDFEEYGYEWVWTDSNTFNTILKDALAIWSNSGWTGIGLGAYASVSAFWKHSFVNPSTAPSSALKILIESGFPTLLLMTAGCLWYGYRLVCCVGKPQLEHRCLSGTIVGLSIGVFLGFLILPGWEIPLLSLLGFTALGLTDRILCHANDLFVEAWDSA